MCPWAHPHNEKIKINAYVKLNTIIIDMHNLIAGLISSSELIGLS